jgi:hypothetical protein
MKLFTGVVYTCFGIVSAIVLSQALLAWTNPTEAPGVGGGPISSLNGNVGIGTTVPGARLEIKETSDTKAFYVFQWKNDGGSTDLVQIKDDRGYAGVNSGSTLRVTSWATGDETGDLVLFESGTAPSFSPRFVIKNQSGNVGIGTTTPGEKLHISSSGETNVRIDTSATAGSIRMKFYPTGLGIVALQGFGANGINLSSQGQSIVFGTGTGGAMDGGFNIRMVIANNGNVGIGAWETSNLPAYQLQLSTNSAAKPTSTAWTVPSDIRIKKDISPFTDGLNVIDKINPVNYKLNGKAGLPMDAPGIGVIAQEVKDIIPYTIKTWETKLNPDDKEETVLYDFDASPMTFVLINAVKEQQKQIEELASKIEELKSKH